MGVHKRGFGFKPPIENRKKIRFLVSKIVA